MNATKAGVLFAVGMLVLVTLAGTATSQAPFRLFGTASDGSADPIGSTSGALKVTLDGGLVRVSGTTVSILGTMDATEIGVLHAEGQATTVSIASEPIACTAGATCATTTNLIPAGSLVLGVTTRVLTLITGATSYSVGDGTDADRWGTGIAVAKDTTSGTTKFTISSPVYYTAATKVTLTAAGSDFTAGTIQIVVHYISLTAPTSGQW